MKKITVILSLLATSLSVYAGNISKGDWVKYGETADNPICQVVSFLENGKVYCTDYVENRFKADPSKLIRLVEFDQRTGLRLGEPVIISEPSKDHEVDKFEYYYVRAIFEDGKIRISKTPTAFQTYDMDSIRLSKEVECDQTTRICKNNRVIEKNDSSDQKQIYRIVAVFSNGMVDYKYDDGRGVRARISATKFEKIDTP
jgi:hypothetical protein